MKETENANQKEENPTDHLETKFMEKNGVTFNCLTNQRIDNDDVVSPAASDEGEATLTAPSHSNKEKSLRVRT